MVTVIHTFETDESAAILKIKRLKTLKTNLMRQLSCGFQDLEVRGKMGGCEIFDKVAEVTHYCI